MPAKSSRRVRRYNFNGKLHQTKTVTRECQRCRSPFSFEMTTKPRRFCDECKVVLDQEIVDRKREAWHTYRKRLDKNREPKPKLIRYAGYDGSRW